MNIINKSGPKKEDHNLSIISKLCVLISLDVIDLRKDVNFLPFQLKGSHV